MPQASVLRQHLCCRVVALALMDREKRVLLSKLPRSHPTSPGLWDISAAGYVRPGETPLDAIAREAAARLDYHSPDIPQARLLPASPLTSNREITIFKSKPCAFFPPLHPGRLENGLFVDEEELYALLRDMSDLTTSALRLTAPYLFG